MCRGCERDSDEDDDHRPRDPTPYPGATLRNQRARVMDQSAVSGGDGNDNDNHDESRQSESNHRRATNIKRRAPMPMIVLMLLMTVVVPVYTAGKDNPNIARDENILPGVTRWNGIPYNDFRRFWFAALMVALGAISQDSYSLLQTARNQDLGSPGNPGTPAQTIQSNNRNLRLFSAIMNYIDPACALARDVAATFANNGRGLYNYIFVYGHLPLSADVRHRLQSEWERWRVHVT